MLFECRGPLGAGPLRGPFACPRDVPKGRDHGGDVIIRVANGGAGGGVAWSLRLMPPSIAACELYCWGRDQKDVIKRT